MRANWRETLFLCGLFLICSPQTAGQPCRGECGEECCLRPSCVPPPDSQACFQVAPHSSCMLGGRALRVLGLNQQPGGPLLCRFRGEIEREGFIDAEGHVYCITPLLFETGWISLAISTDGIHFDRFGEYLSVHPSKADPAFGVTLVNATRWQHYGTPGVAGRLGLAWNSSLVSAQQVNVELWGYRELSRSPEAGPPSLRAELSYLYSLATDLPNTGAFSFTPGPSEEHSQWVLGNIRITAGSKADGERDVEGLWSGGHVLAWHLERPFREDSAAWARTRCLQWDVLEEQLPDFLDELPDCPCTLAQARADSGRFHTDYSCDMDGASVCTHRPASTHCVTALHASPTHGSGQRCCYDSAGALLLTGDSVGGSTPGRAHGRGSPPYRDPPRVPGYSHWLYDVMSFYYCCLWSDHCHVYFSRRPSTGCRNYRPPRAGVVLGDPHFITFDGLNYTFNGKGEYYLVSAPDMELAVEARTEQVKMKAGAVAKATWLSAVAMKERASDGVEVRLAEGHLQVLRNQKLLPFTEQRWMDLHGVLVSVPGPHTVTVMFLSGAAVEVCVRGGAMAVTVLLPAEFTNRTLGLLGRMNRDPSDDLRTRRGEATPPGDAAPEETFSLAAGWNISKNSSLFTYDSQYLLDTYYFPPSHDPTFVPAFSLPETPDDPLVADMSTMCSGDGEKLCKYDTLMSRSLAMGNATLRAYRRHWALLKTLEPVVSCGQLPTPRNGKKNGTHYLEGNTLSFTCNDGYVLYGSTERTCLDDGSWTGEQPFCVTDDHLGFVLGALGSVSALVTMGVMIKLHSRKRDRVTQQASTGPLAAHHRSKKVITAEDREKRETRPDGDPRTNLLNHQSPLGLRITPHHTDTFSYVAYDNKYI